MEQPTPEEVREDLADFLTRLNPPLVLTVSPLSREAVPFWLQRQMPAGPCHCGSFTLARGEKQIQDYYFRGADRGEIQVHEIVISWLLTVHEIPDEPDYDEDLADEIQTYLQTLFTKEEMSALKEIEY